LKFGAGPPKWRRFFALMGSALALREVTPLVKNTPTDPKELIHELHEASKALKVHQRLQGWTNVLRALPRKDIKGFKWLLLLLDTKAITVRVTGYARRREAYQALAELEESKQENLDPVLVWVQSVSDLREAYPNYYADTREFIVALDSALSSVGRR
jgi:hypothetical protein